MSVDSHPSQERERDCSTSDSFTAHGIERGSQLISRTHNRLATAGIDFEPTESFFDRLEEAFIWAYLSSADTPEIPEHVELAISDAKAITSERFLGEQTADLRTDVIPAFYQAVAGFHCAYCEGSGDSVTAPR